MTCEMGTFEHVFHAANALLCIHDLLADEGRILHFSPMQNWVGQRFVQFCPAYFSEYYDWNPYRVDHVLMNRLDVWEFVQGMGTNHPHDADFFLADHCGVFDAAVWVSEGDSRSLRWSARGLSNHSSRDRTIAMSAPS